MTPFHRFLAASALVFPLSALTQDQPSSTAVGAAPVAEPPVRRIEQLDISRAFTARDLIGKDVVNYDGKRLGTINDVGLSETWAERFGTTPLDTNGEPAQPPFPAAGADGDQVVYISTGGLLGLGGRIGVGADWVSVLADNLLYDRAQDRFILNIPQERFENIAKGARQIERTDPSENDPSENEAVASTGDAAIGQGTAAGSTASTADAVRAVEEAFEDDEALRSQSGIQVSSTGNVIELSGEVDSEALARRAGDIARKHTDLEVRNELRPSAALAE